MPPAGPRRAPMSMRSWRGRASPAGSSGSGPSSPGRHEVSEHVATVEWRAAGGAFTENRYSRAHTLRFDGGAEMPASASPQVVPEPMSDPAGVDPEEMLVASASSCHMLWFLDLARQAGLDVAAYRDAAS